MSYKIDPKECTSCGACTDACPESAIHEGDPAYVIDPALCTDCGACVSSCPANAISPPSDTTEEEAA